MIRSPLSAVGAAVLLILSASSAQAVGVFSVTPLTGDADSGIIASTPFALAIDVNDGPNRTVNGAVFTGSGGSVPNPATNNYSTGGLGAGFVGFGTGLSGDIGGTATDFLYGGNPESITLNNLRIGETYRTSFYNSAFDAANRIVSIAASDGGLLATYDQNQNFPQGSIVNYDFVATANTQTYTITPANPGATFHLYNFANQLPNYTALLTDNFYAPGTPDTNDLNFNLEARQGGKLAIGANTVTYSKFGSNAQVGNPTGGIDNGNYFLSAASTKGSPDFNFNGVNSEGGLLLAFDIAPNVGANGDTTVWTAVNIGMSDAQRGAAVNGGEEHFGILFRGNGQIQAFDGGAVVSGAETWTAQTNVTTQLHRVEMLFSDVNDDNPFDGVGQTTIDVYADGQFVFSYTKGGGGYDQNYISLQGFDIGGIDNLLIARASPVPEPSSLALAAFGLVGLIGWGAGRRSRLVATG